MINIASSEKSFVAYADDKTQRIQWVNGVNEAIAKMRDQFKEDTGQLAPVWNPDSTSTACGCCGTQFGGFMSLTNRKHHCR